MDLYVNVSKQIGRFHFQANFRLTGNRWGIFGPSGSGKSTLMHLLAGLLVPDHGTISLAGQTLYDSQRKINLPPEKRRIGVVFQHAHLFPHLSVLRNLLYGWRRIPPAERKIEAAAIIEALHLEPLLRRGVNRLSGGERQRVALGRAVLACPRLILMDEPLTGLDEALKAQIIPYLHKVFSEFSIPILFISHSVQEMRQMTDEVLVFRDGALAGQKTSASLTQLPVFRVS